MTSLSALLAPLALLLTPAWSSDDQTQQLTASASLEAEPAQLPGWIAFEAIHTVPVAQQVRIERRVVIRIAPVSSIARQNIVADLAPVASAPARLAERKMDKCIPMRSIAAARAGQGNQLLLFMRDRKLVSANLEKACLARDFYSGFYVESNEDGMLCVDRDKLQSRSGANCRIGRMRQLVEARD